MTCSNYSSLYLGYFKIFLSIFLSQIHAIYIGHTLGSIGQTNRIKTFMKTDSYIYTAYSRRFNGIQCQGLHLRTIYFYSHRAAFGHVFHELHPMTGYPCAIPTTENSDHRAAKISFFIIDNIITNYLQEAHKDNSPSYPSSWRMLFRVGYSHRYTHPD